jgi:hypothetical protein
MKQQLLDDLDVIVNGTQRERTQWIHEQNDRDLYQVATWLMMHLTPQSSGRNHMRSNIRDMLSSWNGESWTDNQRHFLGHSVIDFWPIRQLDRDPRYVM